MMNSIEKTKERDIKDIILISISSTMYFLSIIYGLIILLNHSIDSSQALLIIIESILGLAIPLIYLIFNKCFHINVSFNLKLTIFLFSFMGIILGETFHFYYYIPYWDKILHTMSGVMISWIGYSLCYYLIKDSNLKNKAMISIIVAVIFSLAFSVLWEFYEYTVDSIFGLNMQKTIPGDVLFNGGGTNNPLLGTDEEIAAFYRDPSGYRYALFDTMTDMLLNALGTLVTTIIFIILNKCNRMEYINYTLTDAKRDI